MKRFMLVVAACLLSSTARGADSVGIYRWFGYGWGPGYHAHNCCAGEVGHKQVVPWNPHVAEARPPQQRMAAPPRRAAVADSRKPANLAPPFNPQR